MKNISSIFASHPLISSQGPFTPDHAGEGSVETINRVDKPKMYKVILLNDDFTPMDFVVLVLQRFFAKNEEQATAVMLDVHQKGAGVAGVFTLEIAEMKTMQVNQFARHNQHPLKCALEHE
jgi:ATP-dependent Clp protease adaptor protein ClpS